MMSSTSSHGTRCCLPALQTNILTHRMRLPNGRLHSALLQFERYCRWWMDCTATLQLQNTPCVVSASFVCPSNCNGGCCSQSPSGVNYSIDTVSSHYRRSWYRHQTARQGMPEASRYPRRPIPEDHWPWKLPYARCVNWAVSQIVARSPPGQLRQLARRKSHTAYATHSQRC